jgi:hypothetical protein
MLYCIAYCVLRIAYCVLRIAYCVLRCIYVGVGVFGMDMGTVVCVMVCIMWVGVWSVSVV